MFKYRTHISILSLALLLAACSGEDAGHAERAGGDVSTERSIANNAANSSNTSTENALSIAYEKITLDNGLDVIFHVDRSDPIVAIDLAVHVGSAREVSGRTGFAHLFEHLLFLDSENLGYGGLDAMNTRIGGEGTNGFTTNDMTQYYQAVPADGLEKIIWAEADKLGYFINTVTQPVIDNEKQVVKNEKRQRVDNQPYGHNFYIIGKALYSEDHPYNWQVIGSLADLEAATLQDVKDFYTKWYVPNNVTVTIAGDFDVAQAKTWVETYFGEIPRGQDIKPNTRRPAVLERSKSIYYEDSFAKVPQITRVWPGVEAYHPDSYALNILMTYLSDGKNAPLNQVLIDEKKLTSGVGTFQRNSELAGEAFVIIRANAGQDLDDVSAAIDEGFARFEDKGMSQKDLDRIKTQFEVGFYGNLESALGKSIQLGEYNIFTGDPGFINKDIKNIQSVSLSDVQRVYETYIKDKPFLTTSIVRKGETALIVEGAELAEIVEEKIVQGAETDVEFDPTLRDFEPTPSKIDRTIEPPYGKAVQIPSPNIWRAKTGNGVEIYGIEDNETPLVSFSLRLDGAGGNRASLDKPAVADLTASLLEKGTQNKTTAELENAIKELGSTLNIAVNKESGFVTGTSLIRNFDATMALVREMLLEPRWDEEEFETLMRSARNNIDQSSANPNFIARREYNSVLYADDNIMSVTGFGEREKLDQVTLDDLKAFYHDNYTPNGALFRIVGGVSEAQVKTTLAPLVKNWESKTLPATDIGLPNVPEKATLYFYDIPDAKQSILRLGYPSVPATHPDYFKLQAVNYLLGSIYTSALNTELRVNKGYTYGIGSGFNGGIDRGGFFVSTSVRTNVTHESLELIRDILSNYGPNFTQEDLDTLKNARIKGEALNSETRNAKLQMLGDISYYRYDDDYRAQASKALEAMTLTEFKRLASTYITPDKMFYVVIGDGATQAERLAELGMGDIIKLNP